MRTGRTVIGAWISVACLAHVTACGGDDGTTPEGPNGALDGSGSSAAGPEGTGGGSPGWNDGSGGSGPAVSGDLTGGAGASGGATGSSGGSEPVSGGTRDGSGGVTGATGGSRSVWRPFNDESPWNTPIGSSPTLHPQSDEWIADWVTSSPYGEHLDVNVDGYSIPLYWADASTPTHTVTCDLGGQGFESSDGFDATVVMPIPDGATPDPESDAHLLVVDRERNLEWGLYGAENDGGSWSCSLGATADLAGSGVRPLKVDASPWYLAHGARACGFPLVAGLIRVEEVEAGRIDHALVVAYPHIRGGCYTSPASTAQEPGGEVLNTRGIPCGGRIQLDPALDLESLGLDGPATTIARALQEYGAYVGDYSGAMSLYGEASPAAIEEWDAILDQSMIDRIPIDRFRVIDHAGPVYADDNAGSGYICE